MLTDKQRQVVDLRDREGLTFKEIEKRLGSGNAHRTYKAAQKKIADKRARLDPGAHKMLDKFGMGEMAGIHSGWMHKEDAETGEWVSTYFFLGKDGQPSEADLEAVMASAVQKVFRGDLATPARPAPSGDHLLVIDIADLHIGKLCVASETGFAYDRQEAIRRGIEGTRALLEKARKHGVGHILFVLGNDVIHIDKPHGVTTSGTPQDTDGTLAVMWDDAFAFYVACIDLCRQVAPVSLLYCPSNHDWFAGFALARSVRAYYRDCPEVSASEYNTSHNHRKYFRFGGNLLGFTHGDGAKEVDLPALMLDEVPQHLDGARRRYWYLHHVHHKVGKRGRGSARRQTEKDLIGMTVMRDDAGLDDTEAPQIEYVRSPSPADGWHHRNGYVNRQAVEVFLHCPADGQVARFTEFY
ncbi:hypothetical protein [Phaeobacter gallaeciensis]|uniref:hypothetical protein n=1 Tax=Phaeobacter gallaeciensis TaxID=60890 RepID=UPI00237F7578|nr:hypothetical protein [Phaeobacter gallaeciensis]MDE4059784.1 hypothetical protein [Phaeobacter gallaeciensis]MDE4122579.1 hypothetical protein [Phaeobacter gallaeciensis]MDE4127272.1 hypothetical protein [Phaeobacter gallaeciensis]